MNKTHRAACISDTSALHRLGINPAESGANGREQQLSRAFFAVTMPVVMI